MSNLSAKFVSAVLLGTVAAATSFAVPARAANNCRLEPGDGTPQGKHWHYRIERGSGRHCWYLRGEDEKSAETPNADPATRSTARNAETSTSRSIADAHAEIAPRTRVLADPPAPQAAPSVWPTPAVPAPTGSEADMPVVAPSPFNSRAPQALDTAPAADARPAATLMVADATDSNISATQDQQAETASPSPPAAAAPERNAGSIQKLILVAAGALALAGLTGSAVYRLGRRRKRNEWLRERTYRGTVEARQDPPWVEPQIVPDLDEARQAAHAEVSPSFESDESGDRVEKIEEFLARFTRQLHAELESLPRAAEEERRANAS